ncbi:MAG: hypothetical protein VB036_05020, partial [Propionicimonas sp.]|nr:hypothetical protein [Propionicimonas sp.]
MSASAEPLDSDRLPDGIEATLESARRFSPDPFPDDPPPDGPAAVWWYPPGEYEAGTLHHLVTESAAVARHYAFADNYRRPREVLAAQLQVAAGGEELVIRGNGAIDHSHDHILRVPGRFVGTVEFQVTCAAGQPATFTVDSGGGRLVAPPTCEVQPGFLVDLEPRIGEVRPAHTQPEPTVRLPLRPSRGLFEAPAEVLARIVVESPAMPSIATGESREEARLARGLDQENVHTVLPRADGSWGSEHALALRYVQLDVEANAVHAEATIRPVPRRGAFVCSDPELSRIWGTSAYTLRLCMQRLVVDGLKRDRMPWIGDQAISVLANAYSFGDARIAYDGLLALGAPQGGYVNGISDYSLWWLITADLLHEYFPRDASPYLTDCLRGLLDSVLERVDERGLFVPVTLPGFDTDNPGSVLIDWGYELPDGTVSTALQMLWVWALESASAVLGRAGTTAAALIELRARALEALREMAWSPADGAWRAFADGVSRPDPYANFLAVAAGISDPVAEPGVVSAFRTARGRTPYLQTIALRALLAAGHRREVLDQVRRDWGAELRLGATSFWEEFPMPGTSPLAMYGRPFARSLCHAWAAGPAALLPEAVFGL